ncbi:MAG: extracellular solute-binding protein [Desulforhopalus sp.]|jgi:spermidine/putrescine transport system substrate-binding protein|nr:extracellular solute-binding protein [Desulforhopalus sp.]
MPRILLLVLTLLIWWPALAMADTLQLLTWKGYAPKELVDAFEKETGIKVEVTYSNNEEMIAKLRATRGAGFDLAQPSQDRISSVQEEFTLYQPIDYSRIQSELFIPSMLEAVKQNTRVGDDSYGVPFCWGTSGLVVNLAEAGEAKSWNALIDPQYAGRISYRLKRPVLIGLGFAMGYDPFALYADPQGYAAMLAVLEAEMIKAKPLVKNYWANGDQLLEFVRSGEVTVAEAWDNGSWKLHEENADIDYVAPVEGALGWIDTFAIPAKAKNLDAAYQWINFMLRPENSGLFTSAEKAPTASKDAGKYVDAAFQANFDRSFPQAVIDNIKWYPPVPAEIEAMEGKVLDKVKAAN